MKKIKVNVKKTLQKVSILVNGTVNQPKAAPHPI